jgi:hypothetical protein
MIPAHYIESKMLPATQGRIAFWPAWIRTQQFGRHQRKVAIGPKRTCKKYRSMSAIRGQRWGIGRQLVDS